jgi:hypothetical protein
MLASMGHVPIAVVYHVARARVRIVAECHRAGQRHFLRAPGSTRVVSVPFHVPSLGRARALGQGLMLGCAAIADSRSHSLMVMKKVGPPRAGGRTRV